MAVTVSPLLPRWNVTAPTCWISVNRRMDTVITEAKAAASFLFSACMNKLPSLRLEKRQIGAPPAAESRSYYVKRVFL